MSIIAERLKYAQQQQNEVSAMRAKVDNQISQQQDEKAMGWTQSHAVCDTCPNRAYATDPVNEVCSKCWAKNWGNRSQQMLWKPEYDQSQAPLATIGPNDDIQTPAPQMNFLGGNTNQQYNMGMEAEGETKQGSWEVV